MAKRLVPENKMDIAYSQIRSYYAALWCRDVKNVEDTAQRSCSFMESIKNLHPFMQEWYDPKTSMRKTRDGGPIPLDPGLLVELMLKKRRIADNKYGSPANGESGYTLWLTNARTDCPLILEVSTGWRLSTSFCKIDTYSVPWDDNAMSSESIAVSIIRALVSSWAPEEAGLFVLARDSAKSVISLRSAIFVNQSLSSLPDLPNPSYGIDCGSSGSVLFAVPGIFSASKPGHVVAEKRLVKLLIEHDLLRTLVGNGR